MTEASISLQQPTEDVASGIAEEISSGDKDAGIEVFIESILGPAREASCSYGGSRSWPRWS
jgi:hypothetical protein